MLLLLLGLTTAFAQDPADDPRPYEAATRALLNGPSGCVQVRGDAQVDLVFVRPGGWRGPGETVKMSATGPFQWTMRDGHWDGTPAELKSTGDGPDLNLQSLGPVIGTMGDGDDEDEDEGDISITKDESGRTRIDVAGESERGLSIVDEILEEVAAEATLSWVEPTPQGGKLLFQRAQVDGAPKDEPLEIKTRFDKGGGATAVDILFPKRIRIDTDEPLLRPVLLDAQVHVRAEDTALGRVVTRETASFVLGLFGFTLGVEQQIRYTGARACPAE